MHVCLHESKAEEPNGQNQDSRSQSMVRWHLFVSEQPVMVSGDWGIWHTLVAISVPGQMQWTHAVVRFAHLSTNTLRPCFAFLFLFLFYFYLFYFVVCYLLTHSFVYLFIYLFTLFPYLFIYLCRAFNLASRARDIIQGNVKALESRFALAKKVESRLATAPGWPTTSFIGRTLLSFFPPKALDPKDDAKVSQPRPRRCLYACAHLFVCLFACACICAWVQACKRPCMCPLLLHSRCVFPQGPKITVLSNNLYEVVMLHSAYQR